MRKIILAVIATAWMGMAFSAAPTVQASAINFTNIGCNSVNISWTNGNGSNRIVAIYPGAITTPSGAYTANQIYGSGATIGGGRVIYNSTGSSVIVVGLNANTTYTVVVYEYNAGPTYLTTTTNSVTVTTETSCSTCPVMTGAIINGCNPDNTSAAPCSGGCGEGDTEILLANSGSYGFVTKNASNTAPANNGSIPFMNYFSSGSSNIADAVAYSANAGLLTTLNSMSGCSNSFVDASAGAVPAYSTIMIVRNTFCPTNYTLTSLCSTFAPIYVLFADPSSSTWHGQNTSGVACSGGNFANSAGAIRYFNLDFSQISVADGGASSAGCNYYYSYNWSSSNDGDGIYFTGSSAGTTSATATAASGKSTGACNLPIVLPVEIIALNAIQTSEGNFNIKWTTATEINNNYFEIQYSNNGIDFIDYKKIKGAGNSNVERNYTSHVVLNSNDTPQYFRIKQVDFNGKYSYSKIIVVSDVPIGTVRTYYSMEDEKIIFKTNSDQPSLIKISIFNADGRMIYNSTQPLKDGENAISVNVNGENGVYFIMYTLGDNPPEHRKMLIYR